MVGDHSDSARGNLLPSHGLIFPFSGKGALYVPSHQQIYIPWPLLNQSWGTGWNDGSMDPPRTINLTTRHTEQMFNHGATAHSLNDLSRDTMISITELY